MVLIGYSINCSWLDRTLVSDIYTSIKAYLYDRTASPLLGSLAVSLTLWNFKILMLFFSNTSYAVKVWEIDYFYSQPFFSADGFSWLTNYWVCVYVLPILTTIFYIYMFPWFSHKVFEHSYNKQIDLNNKKKTLQKSELIDAEDKEKIMLLNEQLRLENRELIVKHRMEVEELQGQIDNVLKDKLSERDDADDSQQELFNTIRNLEKKVEELENDDNVLELNTGHSPEPILEKESTEVNENEEQGGDVSFYFEADEYTQNRYKRILEGLYLEDRHKGAFGLKSDLFDSAMVQLILHNLVHKPNDIGKYSITEEGRIFYSNLNKMRVG